MSDTIVAEGPYLGPLEFAAGIAELSSSIIAQTAVLEPPLIAGPFSIVGAVTASGVSTVSAITATNGILNNIVGQIQALPKVIAFPMGLQPIANGGFGELNTGISHNNWAISTFPNGTSWPPVLNHDYQIRYTSVGTTFTIRCRFETLPVLQGNRMVATVTTQSPTLGRLVLWRT